LIPVLVSLFQSNDFRKLSGFIVIQYRLQDNSS
jgi:hypothetical protein